MLLIKILSILGAVTGITGAILLALHLFMVYAYMLFLISSISWFIVGWLSKNISLILMNLVFLVINSLGIYTYMRLG